MMSKYLLFTDGSSNPQLKTGMGAYLLLPGSYLNIPVDKISTIEILNNIILKRFENTSSTKLEIETVLWALDEFGKKINDKQNIKLELYTDSQCITGIIGRREKLEKNNFISKGSGRELHNADLYKEFYKIHDKLKFDIIKVVGHSPYSTHDTTTRIFSILDREVRHNLKSM